MKLIAALLLIGATTAPAFAGGPVIGDHVPINLDGHKSRNAIRENIGKSMFLGLQRIPVM